MRRSVFVAGVIVVVVGVGLQFVRPSIPMSPVTGNMKAPKEVDEILRNACYDCHSNETHLRWFERNCACLLARGRSC